MTKPLMINAFDPSNAEGLTPEMRALLARRQRVLGPSYKLFYEEPVHLVRAEGVWMFDPQGNRYLDTYNNVPSVGHCHPRVVEAVSKQVAILNTHTRYLHDLILDYAEKLIATFPEALSSVMFTCTGSEAVDLALRVARYATGGAGVIITGNAYHGITSAVSEISPSLGEHVPLGLNVRTVPPPDLRHAHGSDVGRTFANDVQAAVDDLQRRGVKVAALIVDTIFSSDGVFSDPAGFLAPAVDVVRRAGGLFIADEVQPGFGRTGDAMWGFQRHGIVPDMAVIGKPMGNGVPIAAMIARPDVVQNFGQRSRYFNTFGGNPVSCAAALAVLEIIEEEKLIQNARSVGDYLKSGLIDLAQKYKAMGQVRGAGLFIGADLVDQDTHLPDPDLAIRVVNGLRRRFVLISASGPDGHVLKIRPPLPFSRENADQFLSALEDTLREETAKQ